MKGLAELLSTEDGEDIVRRRLQLIDKARGILNSIAIDADGESYDFKSVAFAGVIRRKRRRLRSQRKIKLLITHLQASAR
jgi:hypothetical protein